MAHNAEAYKPRQPYYADEPDGYLESDRDYVLNNIELCVAYLDRLGCHSGQTAESKPQK